MSAALKLEPRYTYDDYAEWDDDQRWELIEGVPYAMAAPSRPHQTILGNLFTIFKIYLKGRRCQVFAAPFDVILDPIKKDNVFQPDILVVCDTDKLKNDKNCQGVPDLVIEIISPSSTKRDKVLKFEQYKKYGLPEYWIVDPEYQIVDVFLLKDGEYYLKNYGEEETIPVELFKDLQIPGADIFDVPVV